jgi:hypothetical protein
MICHRCGWAMFFLAIRDRVLGLARARRVGSMFSTAAPLAVVICFPSASLGTRMQVLARWDGATVVVPVR